MRREERGSSAIRGGEGTTTHIRSQILNTSSSWKGLEAIWGVARIDDANITSEHV